MSLDVIGTRTTLQDSVNVCLSVIGETPVNSITGSSLPTQVALAKQTLREVNRDVQAKGWWFNTSSSDIYIYPIDANADGLALTNNWSTSIPEEARRYITIRAARVLQSRFVSSEELHKFSYNEEIVSLATLQTANVRSGGGNTSQSTYTFSAFPADLKNLGIEEVMFLQGSAEEKLLTLRLGTELKQQAKVAAETTLLADQEALVEKQVLTEVAQELKVDAETALLTAQELKVDAETALTNDQEALVTQQALTEAQETTRKTREAELLDTQETLVTQQKLTEVQETTKRTREHELIDAQETLLQKQILTETEQVAKVQEEVDLLQSQQLKVDKETLTEVAQELKIDAEAALITSQTTTDATQRTLIAAQELKTDAETTLTTKQGALVDAQELKTDAETSLTSKQGLLVDAQELKTDSEKLLVDAQTSLTADQELKTVAEKQLLESQKTQVDTQTALELTEEKAYSDAITGISSGTTYRDFAAELRMMGVQEPTFYQLPAYKKKEALKDATKLRTSTATETGSDATEIATVNNIRRMIGEAPITALNGDSMASEAVRLLRKTSTEMQGRGWWFNTEYDVEFTADGTGRIATTGMLTVELNDYDTRIKNVGGTKYLYDYKTKSHTTFSGTTKGKVIYERSLDDIPQKFQEYLEVRVAILLTEMYPRDGIDIQRLPRIEKELETYFKDRQNEEGNYNIFDNFDTNARIGINRNYDII